MSTFAFEILARSDRAGSRARRGKLVTPHGVVETPAFVTVGTKATVKGLSPEDLEKTGTQFIFSNTYHLTLSPTPEVVAEHGGVHTLSGIYKPTITDSGGFQVFSLAFQNRKNMYELQVPQDDADSPAAPHLVHIHDDGVTFHSHIDGTKYVFTPEFSIDAQQKIGADFMVAFDECIYNGATKKYTEAATKRTHEWAQRSLQAAASTDDTQKLYGVIQGGMFQDLRQWSTKTISEMPFFGIALGGVSVGETNEELRLEIQWIMDDLHTDNRPRHLLGISTFDDVVFAVKQGVDTFDCILPTRDARTGKLYVVTGTDEDGLPTIDRIKIGDARWKSSLEKVNVEVLGNVTYAYLHHLYKQKELLYYRLATMHNLSTMEMFFAEVRRGIEEGRV